MASIKPVVGKKVDAIALHVFELLLDHFRVGPLVEALEGRVWLFVQIGAFVGEFCIVNPPLRAPDVGIIDKGTVFLALQTSPKYYMVDLGIRNHILPRKNYDLGFSLENIVFFELLRRGYHVYVGKLHNTEVDFVAQKQGILTYIQVTASMLDATTFAR